MTVLDEVTGSTSEYLKIAGSRFSRKSEKTF